MALYFRNIYRKLSRQNDRVLGIIFKYKRGEEREERKREKRREG